MPTLTKTTIEVRDLLERLYIDDWFGEKSRREIYVRYYSTPIQPKVDFYVPGLEGNIVKYAETEFRVVVAHIADQTYKTHVPWLTHSEAAKNEFIVEILDRRLPETDYVLISTPLHGTGDQADQFASLRMDGFVGMLRAVGGNNLLRQLVREGTIDLSTGDIKTRTTAAPIPHVSEGPFATIETWEQLRELTDAVAGGDDSQKGRIELSTQLVERAFLAQGGFKFFSYWIALEVAAATYKTGKIATLLSRAYERSHGYVLNDLGFQFLTDTRHAVFHSGEHYELPSDVERYVQCLFLDVVRAKLRLKCRGHMALALKEGFDVTRLDRTVARAEHLTIEAP